MSPKLGRWLSDHVPTSGACCRHLEQAPHHWPAWTLTALCCKQGQGCLSKLASVSNETASFWIRITVIVYGSGSSLCFLEKTALSRVTSRKWPILRSVSTQKYAFHPSLVLTLHSSPSLIRGTCTYLCLQLLRGLNGYPHDCPGFLM